MTSPPTRHPPGARSQTRTQEKRRAILDAALQEFDANGFLATSMDQIAARANVSKRTVYNHFASKDELFEAIRSGLFCQIACIACEYDADRALGEQLAAIATRQVDLLCSDAFLTFARISLPLSLRSTEVARGNYREFQTSNRAILDWINAACEDGRLNVDDPPFAVRQFVGLLKAGVLWPQLIGGNAPPTAAMRKKVVESTVSMFLNEYAVPDGT